MKYTVQTQIFLFLHLYWHDYCFIFWLRRTYYPSIGLLRTKRKTVGESGLKELGTFHSSGR